ncbi:MAG: class I SAM-dependent RNA methyltransferase [Acidimicrobiales bacterium]
MSKPELVRDVDLDVHGIASGGDGIATDVDGRVVFVAGAIPGERVRASVVEERSSFARAKLVEVLDAAPGRVSPPCPHVAEGCGGCGWQHIEPVAQRALKATIVGEALRRIGHVSDHPLIDLGPELLPFGYRTTVRGLVVAGRFAYRRGASHDPVAAGGCLTAHPLVRDLIDNATFGRAKEVVLRAAIATGERLAVVEPTARGVEIAEDVTVIGRDELRRGARVSVHEEVAGRTWRISARSFFQIRPDGAGALVDAVRAAVGAHLGPAAALVDLYSGVGLFAGALGEGGRANTVMAVEGDRGSAADARANLADLGDRLRVVRCDVARWRTGPADVVVADPSRAGLGRGVVAKIADTGAAAVALVACDPASFARDAGLLVRAGYSLDAVTLVDLFPETPHIEVVGAFVHPGSRVVP